ncbi:MAG: AMP-binding protein [Myxococcota bacterium]
MSLSAPATHTGRHTSLEPKEARRRGMGIAITAREAPDRLAIASPNGDRSFDFLNARVNQLVRALRARGVVEGSAVALVCRNRPEFAVAVYAALRAGWRLTPVNWHLAAPELAYIIRDCEAVAVLADSSFRAQIEGAFRQIPSPPMGVAIGDPIHGFEDFESLLSEQEPHDIDDPCVGYNMLYTSGTTGRPKGVHRDPQAAVSRPGNREILARVGYRPGRDLHLVTGPLYHAAPLAFSLMMPLGVGCGVVMMEGFDPDRCLDLIEGYRVTHTHMVPIMFHRLLAIAEDERALRNLSSLRIVLHGAAPCPVPLKRAMMDWLGPVLWEYYAATEGWGSLVGPEEWLEHPGTVGRPAPGAVEVRDEEGKVLPPGTSGAIFMRSPAEGRFEYFKDEEKTGRTYAGDYFTLGDIGYLDADGYLFLDARTSDVIISGGVNIYPAEVDAVLLTHPAVRDSATIGAPDDEWGEQVVSVVELRDGYTATDQLAERLVVHCKEQLAHFKCPKRVEFRDSLPRSDAGKLLRRLVRDSFWEGRDRSI